MDRLSVQRDVEAAALGLVIDPQRNDRIDGLENHEGGDAGPEKNGHDPVNLIQQLLAVALDEAGRLPDRGGGEDAGEERAGRAADAVHAEDVERIVIAAPELEFGAGPEAEGAGDQADDDA